MYLIKLYRSDALNMTNMLIYWINCTVDVFVVMFLHESGLHTKGIYRFSLSCHLHTCMLDCTSSWWRLSVCCQLILVKPNQRQYMFDASPWQHSSSSTVLQIRHVCDVTAGHHYRFMLWWTEFLKPKVQRWRICHAELQGHVHTVMYAMMLQFKKIKYIF